MQNLTKCCLTLQSGVTFLSSSIHSENECYCIDDKSVCYLGSFIQCDVCDVVECDCYSVMGLSVIV